MAYVIDGKKIFNLDNIECTCGKRANYLITEVKNVKVVKLFCDFCEFKTAWEPLVSAPINTNAPWHMAVQHV